MLVTPISIEVLVAHAAHRNQMSALPAQATTRIVATREGQLDDNQRVAHQGCI